MSTAVETEIGSQPDCWRRAAALAATAQSALPPPGTRTAVIGCGTSWFVAQAYAALREAAGLGETDAFPASEAPWPGRQYAHVLLISRSGTTTEVLRVLDQSDGVATVGAITADESSPLAARVPRTVVLDFADERSVVQTRFATTTLALLRASVQGAKAVEAAADAADHALAAGPPPAVGRSQFTFLGTGWTVGLAHEAALKLRESAQCWAESYPAMEYRHGPISVADHASLVWSFDAAPDGLLDEVRGAGAAVVDGAGTDPMAELVRAQLLAVRLAHARGLDPDRPRNLTRSVVLE